MMHKPDLAIVVAAVMLIAAGCAEMRWTKPGADAAAVSRDTDDCRAEGLARAGPRGLNTDVARAGQLVDRGGSTGARVGGTSNERFVAEHEDVRVCMQRRGYQLQPAG